MWTELLLSIDPLSAAYLGPGGPDAQTSLSCQEYPGSAPFRTFPEHLILLHPGQIPTPPQPTPAGVAMVLQVPPECLSSSPSEAHFHLISVFQSPPRARVHR